MTNMDQDHKLGRQFREESDEMLFATVELSDQLKQKIRQQAAVEKKRRMFIFSKAWMNGIAAMAAVVLIVAGILVFQGPSAQSPAQNQIGNVDVPSTNEGVTGSELSQLVTSNLNTVEEAQQAFGPGLLVPSELPEGFTLKEISAVGMAGELARDINFTYGSGDKTITYVVSRMQAAFPTDLFTKTQIGGNNGLIFEQPELTELYWMVDDVQYSIVGNLTGVEARKAAESVQ
ncbi:DUF4367 domain-containing protein [Paenibacillus sp. OV219]|uniref:DUF4367 domain-containing protein n=1 Tax=Paenibacillus sp. OV219 TaxID=1884377 RepID=UPI0008D6FE07|nr:DUF4367 domain-containing protein [Paenibacillus sp. OV219]SEN95722.1 hypothetical protein SAMN05518847_10561 [Paenibacillus sp. OV219]